MQKKYLQSFGIAAALLMLAQPVQADTANFELNGKIYTKWLYKNDATRGCLNLSNPFWIDNLGGGNGVCSEFELNIRGRVSKYVSGGVRLKSRFGALWQNWWENGDTRWDNDNNLFVENTSGESMGMNHAQYIKLRGAWIRAKLPIPSVEWVHIGATDLSMFNEWTIGKARYIDRDNGNGVFFQGDIANGMLGYHFGAIALPKLFVGPRWNSGLASNDPLAGYWGGDWAYAVKLTSDPIDDLNLTLIGSYIHDWEADRYDPDIAEFRLDNQGTDRATDLVPRFQGANATLEGRYTPSFWDKIAVSGLLAMSHNRVNPEYATNSIVNDQGFSPVVFKLNDDGSPGAAQDFAGKVLVEVFDPFDIGLSAKFQYFNIGSDYNAAFGARREADVLLTDGFLPTGFISGGQLPTLNIANEFVDFDEPWYESAVGWHGATALLEYVQGAVRADLEGTFLTYNTNMQNRDIENQYPDFLYTDGFTDIQSFTADKDYANVYDRGRDPRSVYHEFQDRQTIILVLNTDILLPFGNNFQVKAKGKYIHDEDGRNAERDDDDYVGDLYMGFAGLSYQWTNELKTTLGYEYQQWDETLRSGAQETGYFDYRTKKHTGRFTAAYNFGGLNFSYLLEYFNKDQEREDPRSFDQFWRVWRSKATVEVSW